MQVFRYFLQNIYASKKIHSNLDIYHKITVIFWSLRKKIHSNLDIYRKITVIFRSLRKKIHSNLDIYRKITVIFRSLRKKIHSNLEIYRKITVIFRSLHRKIHHFIIKNNCIQTKKLWICFYINSFHLSFRLIKYYSTINFLSFSFEFPIYILYIISL